MPINVPQPSRAAFGAADVQSNAALASTLGSLGQVAGRIGKSVRDASNRAKYHEESIRRLGDMQALREKWSHSFNNFRSNSPYDSNEIQGFKAELEETRAPYMEQGHYSFPESGQRFLTDSNGMMEDMLSQATDTIRENGNAIILQARSERMNRTLDSVRDTPHRAVEAIYEAQEFYLKEGAALQESVPKFLQEDIENIAGTAVSKLIGSKRAYCG